MAIAHGKAALEVLKTFRSRKWFHDSFKRFADLLIQEYGQRNEVVKGGAISDAGSNTATKSNITCSETYVTLQGQSYHASLSASADQAITNKVLENADGDVASLVITYGNTGSGADPSMATAGTDNPVPEIHVVSGGVTFKARIYDHARTQTYDAAASFDVQIDAGVRTLSEQVDDLKAALEAKFTDYTVAKAASSNAFTLTITAASPGPSFNFTYAEKYNDGADAIDNIAGTATDVTDEFSGIIYSDGSVGSGSTSAAAKKYISVIVTNSDNEGGVRAEGTNVQLLAVAAGTSSTAGTTFLSADEIQSALAASSSNVNGYNHSGATGWVYLAEIEKATNGNLTIVSNINNHLGR